MERMSASATRLGAATLARLREGVVRPDYDRAALRPRIVHLGLGAFFRAHGALYTEDVLAQAGGDWGIIGVSLQRPHQRDLLAPQDGLYTALERTAAGVEARIVGCLLGVRVAPEDPAAIVALLAAETTAIVSLTITEKGYCHHPATGGLDVDHADIRHDLARPQAPRTAIGFLVAALDRRRAAGLAPFTVLCCDNLPRNGALLAGLVREFAARRDAALAEWIAAEAAFPATMVDRIVPATTPEDVAAALRAIGLHDAAPIVHEPFRQWVIEDCFDPAGRPDWESAGAQLVSDVAPYEHIKLRLLNAAHSALAYLGLLVGHETVAEAIADPVLDAFTARLWQEIAAVVPPPPGVVLAEYCAQLRARFAGTAIRHRLAQIAMDGSQKLPQRLLATIHERLRRDLPIPCLALAVAAWIRHAGGLDEHGRALALDDPLRAELRAALAAGDATAQFRGVLSIRTVFAPELARDPRFVADVAVAYETLLTQGVAQAARAATTA
jgi:fructuronate reductase